VTLSEFTEQDNYCKENYNSSDICCVNCSGKDMTHCARGIRLLCVEWVNLLNVDTEKFNKVSETLEECGISAYGQLGLLQGRIEFKEVR